MTKFSVYAHGIFCGTFEAKTPEAAIKAAAEEHGTDGNTEGMTAHLKLDGGIMTGKSAGC